MRLLVILLVLGARQLDIPWPSWLARADRHQRFLAALTPRRHHAFNWWLAVALPALVVALVFGWLDDFWGTLLTLILGVPLMLWLVGTESELHRLDEGVLRRSAGLFAAIFWLTVLGYGAACLFVLNRAWLLRRPEGDWPHSLDDAMSWIPARLTVLALALVGHFGAVASAVAGRIWRLDDSRDVLQRAARAALGDGQQQDEQQQNETGFQPAGQEHPHGLRILLWRSLALWLIFVALWILLAS